MKDTDRSKLVRVKVSGYKSFGSNHDTLDIDLRDINVIIGSNGSGKSNFLSFFSLLSHMMTNALQTYVAKQGFANQILHYGSKNTRSIEAELHFQNGQHKNIYKFSLDYAANDKLVIGQETFQLNDMAKQLSSGEWESYFAKNQLSYKNEQIIHMLLSRCRAFQFHDTSRTAYIRNSAQLTDSRYLFSDGGNLPAVLYRLQQESPQYFARIENHIRRMVPGFGAFALAPDVFSPGAIFLNWHGVDSSEYLLGPSQISDGSLRFIALATLLLQPPAMLPNVILIDEPELGLHPQAIDVLAFMLKEASRHAQVIIATQSERLLDAFHTEDIIVAEYEPHRRSAFFKRLQDEQLEEWIEEYSMSQLWDKNILGGQP